MTYGFLIELVLAVGLFAVTVIIVIKANPRGSPARQRRPLAIWHVMVLTALVAVCFALLPATMAGTFSAILLGLILLQHPLVWQAAEMATTAGLLPVALIEYSDISPDFLRVLLLWVIGAVLGLSWILRTCVRWAKPRSRSDWVSLLLFPVSVILLAGLIPTRVGLRMRLAVSEPALITIAHMVPAGSRQSFLPEGCPVGLFRAYEVEEREGCVLWTTGGFLLVAEGLAYIPLGKPPTWAQFEPIQGRWWRFRRAD